MSPKRPRPSERAKIRRLRRFARKAIAMLEVEHEITHDSFKDPHTPRTCVVECEPYLEAIAEGREVLR